MAVNPRFSNVHHPPFIAIEGIDGSGKSTLLTKLHQYFTKDAQCKVRTTKAPFLIGEEEQAKWEEELSHARLSAVDRCNLFLLNRRHHNEYILHQRKDGYAVLSDRYDLSTYAYQANPFHFDLDQDKDENKDEHEKKLFGLIYDCHFSQTAADGGVYLSQQSSNGRTGDFKLQFPCIIPDCTIFCDVKLDVAQERLEKRLKQLGEKRSFFEDIKMLESTFKRYYQAIDFLRKKDDRNIVCIDANRDEESVFKETKDILDHFVFFQKCKKRD